MPKLPKRWRWAAGAGREAFGVEQGWHLTTDGRVDFGGERFGDLQLEMPGQHNRLNAWPLSLRRAMSVFHRHNRSRRWPASKGVKRRMELRGEVGGVRVYDDFAHHPTAIAATITALKRTVKPGERILAVFEPAPIR